LGGFSIARFFRNLEVKRDALAGHTVGSDYAILCHEGELLEIKMGATTNIAAPTVSLALRHFL